MVKELDLTNAAINSYNKEIARQYRCDIPPEHAELFIELTKGSGLVVDAGCGTGDVTNYLSEKGVQIEGFDASPFMIKEAQDRYPDLKANFSVGDIRNLSKMYPPKSVKGILFGYSLIHLADEQEIVQAIKDSSRILVPGGVVYIAFQESPIDRNLLVMDRHPSEREHIAVNTITQNFLKSIYENAGMIHLFWAREYIEGERAFSKGFNISISMAEGVIATLPE